MAAQIGTPEGSMNSKGTGQVSNQIWVNLLTESNIIVLYDKSYCCSVWLYIQGCAATHDLPDMRNCYFVWKGQCTYIKVLEYACQKLHILGNWWAWKYVHCPFQAQWQSRVLEGLHTVHKYNAWEGFLLLDILQWSTERDGCCFEAIQIYFLFW